MTTLMFDTSHCGERYKGKIYECRFKLVLNCLRFGEKRKLQIITSIGYLGIVAYKLKN